jgi:GH25 family lysozyme M1 (1,4-beta-N-acetylmuramidase)
MAKICDLKKYLTTIKHLLLYSYALKMSTKLTVVYYHFMKFFCCIYAQKNRALNFLEKVPCLFILKQNLN